VAVEVDGDFVSLMSMLRERGWDACANHVDSHLPDNKGVNYQVFLRALYNFAKVEMRWGR
jgi:hypothetical protein